MSQAISYWKYGSMVLGATTATAGGVWGLLGIGVPTEPAAITAPADGDAPVAATGSGTAADALARGFAMATEPATLSSRSAGQDARYKPTPLAALPTLAEDEAPVARGQSPDPNDRYARASLASKPDGPQERDALGSQHRDALGSQQRYAFMPSDEPNPLRPAPEARPLAPADDAREAFEEPSADEVQPVRYDQPEASDAAAPPAGFSANPFARSADAAPAASAYGAAAPAGDAVPLPPMPGQAPGELQTIEPSEPARTFAEPAPQNALRAEPMPVATASPDAPAAFAAAAMSEPFAETAPPAEEPAPPMASLPMDAQPMEAQPMEAQPLESRPVPVEPMVPGPNSAESMGAGPLGAAPQPMQSHTPSASQLGDGKPGERALEGPQQPSLTIEKLTPAEVQVGSPAQFVIKVRNTGRRAAEDVTVTDQTPAGARLLATAPQAEASASGGLTWRLGTLSAGEEKTLTMELMPFEEGEIGSVASVRFAAQASARVVCTRPQLALRMTAPAKVLVGRQQVVTIELHNPGTGDAMNVELYEQVPENLRHAAGPALEFEVGTLKAGETRRMELVMTAEQAGRVTNVLTARADGGLEVDQRVEFDIVAPGLALALSGPSKRYLDRPGTYTVSIENPGTAATKDIQLAAYLPQGMKFVKANNLGEYDPAQHAVLWSLAELPEGGSGAVEVTAVPTAPGDLTLRVEGRAREGLSDESAQQVRVEGIAAIAFSVRDLQDPIEVGGQTGYEVRLTNQGSKAAMNVQVKAIAPAGLQLVSAEGPARHAIRGAEVVFEPIRSLEPQAEVVFQVVAQGATAGDQRMTIEVHSDDLQQPVRKEESTRVFGDE
ncbi:Large cysteine-rich periplasmic protein OmcB precursor [Pirellulimonas nuda]|uniref:Large cysteine-rich periplasmic protein OmcB n=1 Tax=Pirellulimonas nuda TaxID=2528009 RepID=A0A518DJG8_9BACT|nr:DUF11 domain-containing protein [Pirellulimonas nuda]QDU91586.1 Large cysteine-rich periplasmic protein OmcB precursor [Pirellulimonas nuda]